MTVQTIDPRTVSAAQAKYLSDLQTEGQRYENLIAAFQNRAAVVPNWTTPVSMSDASAMIQTLKPAVAQKRNLCRSLNLSAPVEVPAPKSYITVTDGMYAIDSPKGYTTYFKVQVAVHGSGRLYAKRLTTDGVFVHAPGAIKDIREHGRKMSLEEAKECGKLYGTCVRCGRTLTDENSIEAGIGPICAGKF